MPGLLIQSRRVCASDFISAPGKGAFAISLNYPGAGIKYFMSESLALEIKGQAGEGVRVGGLRLYNYFRTADRMLFFMGLEADYIDFKGEVSRGTGVAGELFGGFEYFLTPSISLQADFGPAYIYLKDRSNPVSISGVDYVANFGFSFYWGGTRAGGTVRAGKTKKPGKTRTHKRDTNSDGPWLIY